MSVPVLLRASLSLGLVFGACRGSPRVTNGEVEVRRVGAVIPGAIGATRAPAPGDWTLQSHVLRVAIAGVGERSRGNLPGTVLQVVDLAHPGLEALRSLEPLVRIDGREVPLTDVSFDALLEGTTPTLRMTARALAGSTSLEFTRDYLLDPTRGALRVHTEVVNRAAVPTSPVALGTRLGWGGAAPFAPGLGAVTDARTGCAPWVGHADHGLAAAWTRLHGDLTLTFTEESHGTTRTASFTEAFTPPTPLGPRGSLADETLLLVVPGDLTAIARTAAAVRGETVVEVPVIVTGARAEAPTVTVTNAAGAMVLQAEPPGTAGTAGTAERHTTLPLTPGSYTAWVMAPGHAPGDIVPFTVPFTVPRGPATPLTLHVPPGGRIRVEALDAATDRDLPVRIVVRGIPPTPNPLLGPFHDAHGAGVVAVAASGRAELAVPPGRYSVVVSHGPEWTIARVETEVTETLRGDVTARLAHAVPMDDWVACDLHVHAQPSYDSRVTLEDRVASLVAEGIGFATPTEHNVVGDYSAGVAALPANAEGTFRWVPAVEVTTDRSAQPWGHFNVYPYRPNPEVPGGGPPPFLNTTPRAIFRAARQNNPDVIIQVNHPRMQPNIGYFNVTGLDPRTGRAVSPEYDPNFDAIEVFNGFYVGHIDQVEAVMNDWFTLLSAGARYVATGSSDSHQVAYQWAGYPRTYVNVDSGVGADGPTADAATIIRALRHGHAFVTTGPMLFLTAEGASPGDTVALTERRNVTFRVQVRAAPWMDVGTVDLYRDGQRVVSLDVRTPGDPGRDPGRNVLRLDAERTLAIDPGSYVVAVAKGRRGALDVVLPDSRGQPFAFTNPIFFDRAVDQDGDRGATRPAR